MAEYIGREAAIKLFNFAVLDCLGMEPTIRAGDIIKALESIPAADVVEVVRCKDCDMAKPTSDEREMYCTFDHCYKGNNYFCADGRRKNENPN